MKKAYVDVTLEMLNDLLHLYTLKGDEFLLENVEKSPLFPNHIRLHLSGDALPETYSEEPKRAIIHYEATYDQSLPRRNLQAIIIDPNN
jgi:hypothetical protein